MKMITFNKLSFALLPLMTLVVGFPIASVEAQAVKEKIQRTEKSQLAPKALVEATINEAKDYVATNGATKSESELQAGLEKIILPAFDFREMARRSLGKNWKKSNDSERQEFVSLFSDLISKTYQDRVINYVKNTSFSFDEEKVKGKKAFVRSLISVDGDEVSVSYRLKSTKRGWKVYDIVIANVSLVSNYRSEFSGIVRKEGMAGLIDKLKAKKV